MSEQEAQDETYGERLISYAIGVTLSYAATVSFLYYLRDALTEALSEADYWQMTKEERERLASVLYWLKPGCDVDFIGEYILHCPRGKVKRNVAIPHEIPGVFRDENVECPPKGFPLGKTSLSSMIVSQGERERELRYMSYADYLRTGEWQKRRAEAIQRDGYKCVRCGATENLQVHHATYANRGHEHLGDLVTLCRSCHCRTHGIKEEP